MATLVYDYDVPLVQNTTFKRTYQWTGQDVTGATNITIAFKREINGAVLFSNSNGTVVNGPGGEFQVKLDPADTAGENPNVTSTFLGPTLENNWEYLYFAVTIELAGDTIPLIVGTARYFDSAKDA